MTGLFLNLFILISLDISISRYLSNIFLYVLSHVCSPAYSIFQTCFMCWGSSFISESHFSRGVSSAGASLATTYAMLLQVNSHAIHFQMFFFFFKELRIIFLSSQKGHVAMYSLSLYRLHLTMTCFNHSIY